MSRGGASRWREAAARRKSGCASLTVPAPRRRGNTAFDFDAAILFRRKALVAWRPIEPPATAAKERVFPRVPPDKERPADPGKSGLLVLGGQPPGIAAKRSAEVARLTHHASGNAGRRKNTWWCTPRYRLRQSREVTDSAVKSASRTSERDCADVRGAGGQPASSASVE